MSVLARKTTLRECSKRAALCDCAVGSVLAQGASDATAKRSEQWRGVMRRRENEHFTWHGASMRATSYAS